MGCCLSTTTSPPKPLDQDVGTRKLPGSEAKGGAKPPAFVPDEEETVKEVVSETQTHISSVAKHAPTLSHDKLTTKLQLQPNDRSKQPVEEQEEISVVSEMYSISISATTVNDGDEGGEVNQRLMINHSLANKKRSNSRVNARAKQGGLRSLESSSSPVITRGHRSSEVKSRPAQGRTVSSVVQRRKVGRRDRDWQGLVKRSGSPGAAISEVITNQRPAVSSVTGHPGGQSRIRKLEESKRRENHDGGFSRESLDNPRVSLECFIFL